MKASRAALSMFTALRIDIDEEDLASLARHFWVVPVVGLLLGMLFGGSLFLLREVTTPLLAAALVLLGLHMFNRFFHMDGLIDLGDGLVATGDHERRQTVMKDTHVGAGGVTFAVLFVTLNVAALASLPWHSVFMLALAAEVLSKNAMVSTAAFGRPRGRGLGATMVASTRIDQLMVSSGLAFGMIMAVGIYPIMWLGADPWWVMVIASLGTMASILIGLVVAYVANRNIGAVNGDVLGAVNEIARPFVILVMLAVVQWSGSMLW